MNNHLSTWAHWVVENTPFYVFPLRPNTKKPLRKGVMYGASRVPAEIDAWWTECPNANIGIAYWKSGHSLIELDVKDGGPETWRGLCQEYGEAPTLTWLSRSGGPHYVYHDPDGYLATKGKVWDGIDTRGHGGLGVAPGSIIDGQQYTIGDMVPIAPLPDWIKEGRKTKLERDEAVRKASASVEADTDLALIRAADYLEQQYAAEGGWGQEDPADTYSIAARLHDLGISEGMACDLMLAFLGGHETSWLKTCVHNVYQYAQNDFGCDRPRGADERFAGYEWVDPAVNRRAKWEFRTPSELFSAEPITYWDHAKCLPKIPGGCAIIAYGPMSSHKTGVVMKFCLDAVERGAKVLYLAPEGAYGINTARLPKAMEHREKPIEALDGSWYTFSITPGLMSVPECLELVEACREQEFEPDIVVIDTLTRAAGANDISAPNVGAGLVIGMEMLARHFDAAIIAVTHPGKDASRGSIGSSLVESLAYAVWNITSEKGVEKAWLYVGKMKDGPADFTVEFQVHRIDGVPVITGGTYGHRPAARAGRKPDQKKWSALRGRVIERLRLVKDGDFLRLAEIVGCTMDTRKGESPTSAADRKHKRMTDLKREASKPDGLLWDLIETTEDNGVIDENEGFQWRLSPELRKSY